MATIIGIGIFLIFVILYAFIGISFTSKSISGGSQRSFSKQKMTNEEIKNTFRRLNSVASHIKV